MNVLYFRFIHFLELGWYLSDYLRMSEDHCMIQSSQNLNSYSPVLVNFEYGSHSKSENTDLKCELYVDPENHSKRSLIVSKNDQKFLGKLSSDETLCHTLILVRNKLTKKGRIFLTQSCTLINSQREEESLKRKLSEKDQQNESRDWQSQYHKLRQSFGSKKSKRASGVALKLNLDMSLNKEEIRETVSGIDVKLNEVNTTNQGDEDIMKLLPQCNRSALVPEQVYSVDSLLTKDERESLRPSAEFLLENGLNEVDQKSNYFIYSHYNKLGPNPDIEKVILLIYGNSLIRFFNMKVADLRAKDGTSKICPQSRAVALKILKEFTVTINSVRTIPTSCKDKTVCHLIVTLLLAFNLQVDIEALSSCIKGFGQRKLIQLARVVGMTFVKGNTKLYSLKIPLAPLPTIRQAKKK